MTVLHSLVYNTLIMKYIIIFAAVLLALIGMVYLHIQDNSYQECYDNASRPLNTSESVTAQEAAVYGRAQATAVQDCATRYR